MKELVKWLPDEILLDALGACRSLVNRIDSIAESPYDPTVMSRDEKILEKARMLQSVAAIAGVITAIECELAERWYPFECADDEVVPPQGEQLLDRFLSGGYVVEEDLLDNN